MRYIRIFFLVASFFLVGELQAQDASSFQRSYENGKGLYNLEKYALAMEALKPLTREDPSNPYVTYASFYYALSALKLGQDNLAKNMLLQLNQKYPNWENADDVNYWLSAVYLKQGAHDQGIKAADKIKAKKAKADAELMVIHFLKEVNDIDVLKDLLQQNPYNSAVAKVLAQKLGERPLDGENAQLLDFLINEFDLNKDEYVSAALSESRKKESYNVGVFFPFMVEDLSSERKVTNQFVLDTYEGIRLAVEKLNENGKSINLYAYDTKKDSATTVGILSRPEIRQMDLIIGPLYPASSKLVSSYAYQHKINMVNPLSYNYEVIGGNPMSFLFKPTLETQAKAAALYASETFKENPSAIILYGTTAKDSILAYTYKKIAEENGLEVSYMKKSESDKAAQLLNFLTESETNELGVEVPVVTPGHIFITMTDELVVANAISAIEIRGDKLPVIALEDWLDLRFVSYEQLERLQIKFIAPNYINYEKEAVESFKEKYINATKNFPSEFAYSGYDMMLFFGDMLHEYGNYFQQGFSDTMYQDGYVFEGYSYGSYNDNQVVPIVQFNNSVLEVVNYAKPTEDK